MNITKSKSNREKNGKTVGLYRILASLHINNHKLLVSYPCDPIRSDPYTPKRFQFNSNSIYTYISIYIYIVLGYQLESIFSVSDRIYFFKSLCFFFCLNFILSIYFYFLLYFDFDFNFNNSIIESLII